MNQENKMGTQPVASLLLTMAIPMVISMLVQALYNVVDSMFVAQISENALTAVSLAYPWQTLMIGVAVGTGVGCNAMISRWLGAGQTNLVKSGAEHALVLALLSAVVFAIAGTALSHVFFTAQTNVAEIVQYGDDYMKIISMFCFGLFFSCITEKLLSSTGRTTLTMVTQASGALTNIILDPIMIFGYFGFPAMGVTGAAIATVIGQTVGALLGIWLNLRWNKELPISFKGFKWNSNVVGQIYSVGIPSIIMQCIGDDLSDEHSADYLLHHGNGRIRGVFQAAELRVHARFRPQQQPGTHCRLQLWRQKAQADSGRLQGRYMLCHHFHGHRLCAVHVLPGTAAFSVQTQ